MAKKPPKVVLDTNIIVSALIYGGKPEQTYNLIIDKEIQAVISSILLAELIEILIKKFNFDMVRIGHLEKIIKKHFKIVYPNKAIDVVIDDDDNRVLEAAMEGSCDYIITGDKELLELESYASVKIMTADQFLKIREMTTLKSM